MQIFTLENQQLRLTFGDIGASWLSCIVKMPTGEREVLVASRLQDWHKQTAYFGATIGRYANRIANASYCLNGKRFILTKNNGEHHLHGGNLGADKQSWQLEAADKQTLKWSKIFADGEEGFGGEVQAFVTYRLEKDRLQITFEASSREDTPLCLTNHAYFNLSGEADILSHRLQLNASHYLPVSKDGIPNAQLQKVEGTNFDFRHSKVIGKDFLSDPHQQAVGGYDHAFLLMQKKPLNLTACPIAAQLAVADLALEIRTTMPAIQVYTGNFLSEQPNTQGGKMNNYAGIALEPEYLPDSPNHPEWWQLGGILRQGERYFEQIEYRFIPLLGEKQ